MGATDIDLADFFEVEEKTINNWKDLHPEFLQSIKTAKAIHDDEEVVQALRKRATGFSVDSEKIFCDKEGEIIRAKTKTYYPPDTAAAFIWLKNRKKGEWKDQHEVEVNVSQLGNLSMEQLIELAKPLLGGK